MAAETKKSNLTEWPQKPSHKNLKTVHSFYFQGVCAQRLEMKIQYNIII